MSTKPDGMPQGQPDFSNPTNVAVAVTELRGAFALLQQQTNGAINNLTSGMQALQAEVRAMHQKFDALPQIQHQQKTLDANIDRAFDAIAALASTTNNNIDGLRKDHKDTRERVIKWAGGAIALAAVAGVGVGVIIFYERQMSALEAQTQATHTATVLDNSRRLREAELFIARSNIEAQEPKE